jgi:hypothetical protein
LGGSGGALWETLAELWEVFGDLVVKDMWSKACGQRSKAWVQMGDYGLILWENGAQPLISIFRPVLDRKINKNYRETPDQPPQQPICYWTQSNPLEIASSSHPIIPSYIFEPPVAFQPTAYSTKTIHDGCEDCAMSPHPCP